MKNKKIFKNVGPWVKKSGKTHALKVLTDRGVSFATADKMVRLKYGSIPSNRIALILLEEMTKDGIEIAVQLFHKLAEVNTVFGALKGAFVFFCQNKGVLA